MRRLLFAVGLATLGLAPLSHGAPMDGTAWLMEKVEAGTVSGGRVTEPGCKQFIKTYAADQRACVVVIGDHNPVVDLEIKVYDSKNQLIAADRGQGSARDFVAVMWYPPRQETYRIEVCSYGQEYNQCSIAFK
jgi:hypothetical protein